MFFSRFPFTWGAPVVAEPPAPEVPPFWVKDTPGVVAWHADGAQLLPRFEHIYPQDSDIGWTKKESV